MSCQLNTTIFSSRIRSSAKTRPETKLPQGTIPSNHDLSYIISICILQIQYLNLSLLKTVFIANQNETREGKNCLISFLIVLNGNDHNDYMFVFDFCALFFVLFCLVEVIVRITSCHDDCNCSTGAEIASHQYTTNNLFHSSYFKIIY